MDEQQVLGLSHDMDPENAHSTASWWRKVFPATIAQAQQPNLENNASTASVQQQQQQQLHQQQNQKAYQDAPNLESHKLVSRDVPLPIQSYPPVPKESPSPPTPPPIRQGPPSETDHVLDGLRQSSLEEPRDREGLAVVTSSGDEGKVRSAKRAAGDDPIEGTSPIAKRPYTPDSQANQGLRQAQFQTPRRTQTQHTASSLPTSPQLNFSNVSQQLKIISPAVFSPPSREKDLDRNKVTMLLQPETRPITDGQLLNEVKGIYAGLVMVEKKCIEIDQQQARVNTKLSNEQWQALIALHRTLLHEHHDFFSASQHPAASDELKGLATAYAMPARMWRHGIHAFLELLRHKLPDSLEHMLAFVYLAYSMMTLLMESVPSFIETWIECLGDLARYRMAIEEFDLRDREIWSGVARMWYNLAADLSPNVGRIQHHLAVLARPNIPQQLFFYSKALVNVIPFTNARDSIMLLFSPLLEANTMMHPRYPIVESSLVTAAGVAFTHGPVTDYHNHIHQFHSNFDGHLARTSTRFKVQGPEIASSIIALFMNFGNPEAYLWKLLVAYRKRVEDLTPDEPPSDPVSTKNKAKSSTKSAQELKRRIRDAYWEYMTNDSTVVRLSSGNWRSAVKFNTSDDVAGHAGPLFQETTSAVATRIGDKNVVPYMHLVLGFLVSMSYVPEALVYLEDFIPWNKIVVFLNTVSRSGVSNANIESDTFPQSFGGSGKQLPEDFPMRGLSATEHYYPPGFFDKDRLIDEDERSLELPSHQAPRAERCLWSGIQIARVTRGRYMTYDVETKQFEVAKFAESLLMAAGDHYTLLRQSQTLSVEELSHSMAIDV